MLAESGRATIPSVLVVTNLYPDSTNPAKGTFVRNSVEQLTAAGWNVRLVALRGSRTTFDRARAYLAFYLAAIRAQLSQLSDGSELVYVHYTSHCAPPVLMARGLGARGAIVAHVHGSDVIPERGTSGLVARIKRALSGALLRRAALVVVPSSYFADVVHTRYAIPHDRIFVSPSGGIDTHVFAPSDTPEERRGPPPLRLLFVGRLIEEKGPLDFLHVVRQLAAGGLSVAATMVGEGPLAASVDTAAEALAVRRIARLPQSELAALVTQHDLFLFPSSREAESLGLVGLEAMACGLPIVAYKCGGATTYVRDGVNGYLVAPRDLGALERRVRTFAELASEARAAMRVAARETASQYDSRTVAAALDGKLRALR
jgi:glycosyltransferase involved in cell wall biosynthesis